MSKWSEEDWQTKDGEGEARQEDGSRKRYLPKKAWEKMDEGEKEETDAKKQEGSKEGMQFVGNTGKAKEARKQASEEEKWHMEGVKADYVDEEKGAGSNKTGEENDSFRGVASGAAAGDEDQIEEEEEEEEAEEDEETEDVDDEAEDDEEDFEDDSEDENEDGEEAESDGAATRANGKSSPSRKRKQPPTSQASDSAPKGKKPKSNNSSSSNKGKSNTVGSKHDPTSAPQGTSAGSAQRLPEPGQRASWKALPGWVHGEVLEVATEAKEVEGKKVRGSQEDPRIVLRADSGKVCAHRAGAVYF